MYAMPFSNHPPVEIDASRIETLWAERERPDIVSGQPGHQIHRLHGAAGAFFAAERYRGGQTPPVYRHLADRRAVEDYFRDCGMSARFGEIEPLL